MKDQEFLDNIMGFNPSDLTAFQENPSSANDDPQVYKTNPVTLSKTEDGNYHAVVKILYNPFNIKESVIKQVVYNMQDENGYFSANSSLSVGDKRCPLFSSWKKLHFAKKADGSEDSVRKAWGDNKYQKREYRWVLVQIIEDENQPELVGQIKAWKLPKTIWKKMDAKMNPTPESKKTPQVLMDYLFSPVLVLDVQPGPDDKDHPERKQREISYDLCEFDSGAYPIITAGGEPLFTPEEIETIEAYYDAKQTIAKESTKQKTKATEKKISEANAKIEELTADVKTLYMRAIKYMKENAFDIAEKFGYKQWDEELEERVQKWISRVAKMEDPASPSMKDADSAPSQDDYQVSEGDSETSVFEEAMDESDDENMPF